MNYPELLSPVGDFECLKAAVQNGADCVYFGASSFSARASATNFNLDELKQAISYAKLRNVKTNLTLNTLIKNDEFEDAIHVASKAYEFGIDAIIVQDLGLAKFLIKHFPQLPIHASTQMTVHNLEGAKLLENLGFSRVVLSRELSFDEIKYICENTNIEIETFIHGALCMSYSGRCLFSSMIGGRSGNRGRCAQPCRLPYELLDENEKLIDKGYLLSPRDLCGLEYLPQMVQAGVNCFKIEGRMKTPEYVATVTRIYRKYLDKIFNNEPYVIEEKDKKDLLQVFNRGGFSNGHLETEANKNLVFKHKPNNMGICIGTIKKYIPSKTYIEVELCDEVSIGDSIMMDSENNKYNVSELLQNNKNVKSASSGIVWIGRIKGKIDVGGKLYKIESKELNSFAENSFNGENIRIPLNANISIKANEPVCVTASALVDENSIYHNIEVSLTSDITPESALNSPITAERISNQFLKTGNTQFYFENINIDLDDNLYISGISRLNELRRNVISALTEQATRKIERLPIEYNFDEFNLEPKTDSKISLLLNYINTDFNYSDLEKVDRVYLPLSCFDDKNADVINSINTNIYIYLPSIIRQKYIPVVLSKIEKILKLYNIKGFVLSNLADIMLLENYINTYELIGNYTLNVFNNYTINELHFLGITDITVSPELSKLSLMDSIKTNSEIITYGQTPVMTMNYCLLGKSNHCYSSCPKLCNTKKFYLKDRMGFKFRVVPDNTCTITTLYNSKITSINTSELGFENVRIDILDENVEEINDIINSVKSNSRLEGQNYTNGNFNREV